MSTSLSDSGRAPQVADPVARPRAAARGAVAEVHKNDEIISRARSRMKPPTTSNDAHPIV
jgi:hypothetical protein